MVILKRHYSAPVDTEKYVTTINLSVANTVMHGKAPVNDTISVPLEIKGRKINISCLVMMQEEKVVIGRQCLQTFGLLAGIVPKPSVHLRLGERVSKKSHNNKNNRRSNNGGNHRGRRGGGGYRSWGSRQEELRNILYPGNNQDVLQIDASPEDLLMQFD